MSIESQHGDVRFLGNNKLVVLASRTLPGSLAENRTRKFHGFRQHWVPVGTVGRGVARRVYYSWKGGLGCVGSERLSITA